MATVLSSSQWIEILLNTTITDKKGLAIFRALYGFEGHKAFASQIGRILGYTGKSPHAPLNSEIGRYAKRIAVHYEIDFTVRSGRRFKYWDLFFNGWDEGRFFVWQLRKELIEALEETELTGQELLAEEISTSEDGHLSEGMLRRIVVNAYERNKEARELCIKAYGSVCSVCLLNFKTKYGELGEGFIHVHHLKPISEIGKSYEVNPIEDLRPVCPNCHAMLHRSVPMLTIEELRDIVNFQQSTDNLLTK